jgi:hypothetical protein
VSNVELVEELMVEDLNLIETIVPIPIEDLKKSFVDKSIVYAIDYANSRLKGKAFLAYISNLNVNVRLRLEDGDEKNELISEYLKLPLVVNILELELHVIELLLTMKALVPSNEVKAKIIADNSEILDKWMTVLDSLIIYPFQTIMDGKGPIDREDFQKALEEYPIDNTDSPVGINFVNLLKHHDFFVYYQRIDLGNVRYFKSYFTENLFKGATLYSYWANVNNTLYLGTIAIVDEALKDLEES